MTSTRITQGLAAISLVAVLVWLSRTDAASDPAVDDSAGPSATTAAPGEVPRCDFPLVWRVARVDPEFGATEVAVRGVAGRASDLWNEAVGAELLREGVDGFPIRLIYGEAQRRAEEIRRVEAELEEERRRIAASESELDDTQLASARADYAARVEAARRDFSAIGERAGELTEVVRTDPEGELRVSRELRVHRFTDLAELERVLAHEMGHALGVAHVPEPDALMAEVATNAAARVTATDVLALETVCAEAANDRP